MTRMGLVFEIGKALHGLSGHPVFCLCLFHQRMCALCKAVVTRLSQHKIHVVLVAKVVDLRTGKMGVATQNDAHVRPRLTKGFHQALENADESACRKDARPDAKAS